MYFKLIILLITSLTIETMILFDFNIKSDISDWLIVDDVVMGGKSNGSFELNTEGHGVFSGKVSLDNNGGFSSLRYRFNEKNVEGHTKAILKVKGDGKSYQFRVKSSVYDRHSYIATFQTTGEWQTIEIILKNMYPAFRGYKLEITNYPIKVLEEVAFLIGNKKEESFQLEIDSIILE
jgi:hypothetical protein